VDGTGLTTKVRGFAERLSLVEEDLRSAAAALTSSGSGMVAERSGTVAGALEKVRDAARRMAELSRLLDAWTDPSPAQRSCPACRRLIMLAATRCGYCWTKMVASQEERL